MTTEIKSPPDKKAARQSAIERALENILEDINTMSHSPEILHRLIKADLGIFYSEVDLIGYCAGLRVGAMLRDKPDYTTATDETKEKGHERYMADQEFFHADPNSHV